MKPYIGIPCQTLHRAHSGHLYHGSMQDNIYAVEAAGGIPVLLPLLQDMENLLQLLAILNGLVFAGGPDVQPSLYGEEPDPKCYSEYAYNVYPQFDTFEMHLLQYGLSRDIPILAVCRGMQLLNVMLGGSLYQDISTQCPGVTSHIFPGDTPEHSSTIHQINIQSGTHLHKIVGTAESSLHSRHHQAIKSLGDGIQISAYAEDGIIEAIEMPAQRFVMGIQGHPGEMAIDHPMRKHLFSAFTDACSLQEVETVNMNTQLTADNIA